ncbi:hypothetical protein CPC16_003366, partial [Podila verticillata]
MFVKRTFVALVSLLIASSVSANKKKCEKACIKEYDPICARSKTGEFKEFGNTCTFEIAVCSELHLHWPASNSPCEDPKKNCEKACTAKFDPVCARSKQVNSKPYLLWQKSQQGSMRRSKEK